MNLLRKTIRNSLLTAVSKEVDRSKELHGNLNSRHEAYGVVMEEIDEWWDEVKAKVADKGKMEKEAIQVAAMMIKFIEDVVYKDELTDE